MKLDEVQGFLDMYDAKLNEDCSIMIGGMTVYPVVSYNGFHRFFKNKGKKHTPTVTLDNTVTGKAAHGQVVEMKPPPPSSIEFLQKAVDLQQERAKSYDVGGTMAGERSMGRTVQAFNIITGHTLRESDGWLLLQLLKDVRDQTNGPHMDSLEDCVSYAALKAEARAAGK